MLAERQPTDAAVQEALLALPYAYSRLNVHGRAAVLYGRALDTFGHEMAGGCFDSQHPRRQIPDGAGREEIRQDKDWVIRLRACPRRRRRSTSWPSWPLTISRRPCRTTWTSRSCASALPGEGSFDAFEDIIRTGAPTTSPCCRRWTTSSANWTPGFACGLRSGSSIDQRLQHMLIAPTARAILATAGRARVVRERLGSSRRASAPRKALLKSPDLEEAHHSACKGVLNWRLETEYHERFTTAHENLVELNEVVDAMQAQLPGVSCARGRPRCTATWATTSSIASLQATRRARRSRSCRCSWRARATCWSGRDQ
jgi:hypothetical protein